MAVSEHIFGDDRPHAQCHGATVAALPGGRLVAAWFGGSREKNPDVRIWWAVRDGGVWSPPRQLTEAAPLAHWNPVLFVAPDGRVHIFLKVGLNPRVWSTWAVCSDDQAETWSRPRELVPGDVGGRGPVKNKPIVLSDGSWLAPASSEVDHPEGTADWDVFCDRSTDGGRTWHRTANVPRDRAAIAGAGAIQPTLWQDAAGRVQMLCRSTAGRILASCSDDQGLTWSPLAPTDLPNNNSGIDVARLPGGRLVLAANPVAGDWAARTPLSLAVSADDGASWQWTLDLETAPGEYSYPSVAAVDDEEVAVVYTWRRERIACWQGAWTELRRNSR